MFGLVLIIAVAILHLYVLWRSASAPFLRRRAGAGKRAAAAALLFVLFVAGRLYGHDNTNVAGILLERAGMIWMAILFLIAVPLLAVDVATGFGLLTRKHAPRLREGAMALGVVLSAIALVQGTRAPVVVSYDVELPGLPPGLDGTVLAGLSDLHLGTQRGADWLRGRVARVLAEQPDLIVLLGDIFEGHGPPSQEVAAVLAGLQAPFGVWAVLGNHEFHGRIGNAAALFGGMGITLLRNESRQVRPGLTLAGVDDLTSNHRSGSKADLVTLTLDSSAKTATVLLSHTPWSADRAARAGAGLMLSGHTHGGQIWPFGYLVKRFYPLLAGRYDVDGMTVIVCRGTGLWGPPMRLWRPGEIIRVTLRAKKEST